MTIIQPNNNKIRFNLIAFLTIGVLLLEAVLAIFAYSHSVHLQYALDQQLSAARELRAENVDLENVIYDKISFSGVEALAGKLGLIREKRPEYLTSVQR